MRHVEGSDDDSIRAASPACSAQQSIDNGLLPPPTTFRRKSSISTKHDSAQCRPSDFRTVFEICCTELQQSVDTSFTNEHTMRHIEGGDRAASPACNAHQSIENGLLPPPTTFRRKSSISTKHDSVQCRPSDLLNSGDVLHPTKSLSSTEWRSVFEMCCNK
jgi:hypothetical protein